MARGGPCAQRLAATDVSLIPEGRTETNPDLLHPALLARSNTRTQPADLENCSHCCPSRRPCGVLAAATRTATDPPSSVHSALPKILCNFIILAFFCLVCLPCLSCFPFVFRSTWHNVGRANEMLLVRGDELSEPKRRPTVLDTSGNGFA